MVFRIGPDFSTLLADLADNKSKTAAAQSKADAAMSVANTARSTANTTSQDVATLNPQVAAATSAVNSLPTTLAQAAAEHAVLQANIDAEAAARKAADDALQVAVTAQVAKTVTWETASLSLTAAVLVNGALSLSFTWQAPMPVAPTKVRLLSPVPLTNIVVATPTTTGCTVTAKAGLALGIGATFHLIAIRYA